MRRQEDMINNSNRVFPQYEMDPYRSRKGEQTEHGLLSVENMPSLAENSSLQERFLCLVKDGISDKVEETLRKYLRNMSFNIDCLDTCGRTALELATIRGNNQMVMILLSHGADLGDSLLYAVDTEKEDIVRTLLSHTMTENIGCSTRKGIPRESLFAPYVTPVLLAAHRNNYNILKILLQQRFPRPSIGTISGSTNHSVMLDYYRAVASPCYILLTSQDPFETAFGIKEELNTVIAYLETGRREFQELSDQLDEFTAEMIGFARCSDEVMTIVNIGDNMEDIRGVRMRLLQKAIKVGNKKFVVQRKCQELLNLQFYGFSCDILYSPEWMKMLAIWLLLLLTPVLATLYLVFPKTRLGHNISSPLVKYSMKAWSWNIFLIIMVFLNSDMDSNWTFLLVGCYYGWVLGMAWEEIKKVWTGSVDAWNMWDLLLLICNMAAAGCYLGYFVATGRDPSLLFNTDELNPLFIGGCLLVCAVILSFARYMCMLIFSETIGPLQLSLYKMVVDICRFLVVFFIVILGFACALQRLYLSPRPDSECFVEYYQAMKEQRQVNNASFKLSVKDFCDYGKFARLDLSVSYLFWTLYGKFEFTDLDVTSPNAVQFPEVSTWLSRILFILYVTMSIIILLNMLIAMMSDSFSSVSSDAEIEWRFARSREMLKYIPKGRTLPPPFNLIPTPKSVWYFMKWFIRICRDQSTRNVLDLNDQDEMEGKQILQKYKVTVKRLSARYLLAYSLHRDQTTE